MKVNNSKRKEKEKQASASKEEATKVGVQRRISAAWVLRRAGAAGG